MKSNSPNQSSDKITVNSPLPWCRLTADKTLQGPATTLALQLGQCLFKLIAGLLIPGTREEEQNFEKEIATGGRVLVKSMGE